MNAIMILLLTTLSFAASQVYQSEGQKFIVEEFVSREDTIWGFDFLPDGKIIFTERSGKMLTFDPKDKKVSELSGVPKVYAVGQGGLLDVRVHPNFKNNHYVYFTYSEPVGEKSTTALGRAELRDNKLTNFKKLFSAFKENGEDIHYGSRLEFDDKGHLFMTVGDRNSREKAQDLRYHNGKLLRLKEDGTAADDNPYAKEPNAKPEIYSMGIRSPQGLAFHPETGELWEAEMGPRGGDEINLIKPKANYGWPVATYGREYHGPSIGKKEVKGMEAPIAHWVPSISPSGMSFYSGDKFPKWKGNLFLGTLSGTHIHRLVIDGHKVVKQEVLLEKLGYRFRNLRQGTDGYLYFSTDEGKIGRLINQ